MNRRPTVAGIALLALLVAVALPAMAANPKSSAAPGQAKAKVEKTEITLNGTIQTSADADGKDTYTLDDGGKTYTLEAGPAWFFGDAYPLKPFVGQSVTVVGEVAEGSTEVDVRSVNGTALREAGKPPWAGGWKRVGERHPGWSQEKADRFKARFGDCFPPGQCKDKPAKPDKADEPEASEAP
jgi:hypothetical protein